MHRVFLGLGGNIGNLRSNFRETRDLIEGKCGMIVKSSSIYRTPPLGFESHDFFWNQVLEIGTSSSPEKILLEIAEIEHELGRTRIKGQYTSRPMDIDILYFDGLVINTSNLQIPHPRIQERKFVLVPLVEIAPDFIHPLCNKSNTQLLEQCKDNSIIEKLGFEN
jgi:2-amino-4-hydroxy-6-hydroxymethyldihydropteridine diphosphokinase